MSGRPTRSRSTAVLAAIASRSTTISARCGRLRCVTPPESPRRPAADARAPGRSPRAAAGPGRRRSAARARPRAARSRPCRWAADGAGLGRRPGRRPAARRRSRRARRRCRRWPATGVPVALTNAVPVGVGDDGRVALEQHDARRARRPAGGPRRSGRRPTSAPKPRELPVVRGEQVGAVRPRTSVRLARPAGQRVGVDDHRQVGGQHLGQHAAGVVVGAHAGADHPGLHPAGVAGPAVGDDRLRPGRADAVGRRAGVADQARPGAQRGPGAEHGGAGVGRRAGDDADHARGVLVVAGRRRRRAGRRRRRR